MRKEKQQMENDMLQQKETIEAFQVFLRTIPWDQSSHEIVLTPNLATVS